MPVIIMYIIHTVYMLLHGITMHMYLLCSGTCSSFYSLNTDRAENTVCNLLSLFAYVSAFAIMRGLLSRYLAKGVFAEPFASSGFTVLDFSRHATTLFVPRETVCVRMNRGLTSVA
jgi:hypothetical protein